MLSNAPFVLNLDCDQYINNSKALREAMCFLMDPQLGKKLSFVQFPRRFDAIDSNDRYANRNTVFFDVRDIFLNSSTRCNSINWFSNSYFNLACFVDHHEMP